MVGDDADPATRVGPPDGSPEATVQHLELVVDLDAQGLERLSRRVPAASPLGSRDGRLDDVDELEGGLNGGLGPRLADPPGDLARKALVAVYAEDSGEVSFVVGVYDLLCG